MDVNPVSGQKDGETVNVPRFYGTFWPDTALEEMCMLIRRLIISIYGLSVGSWIETCSNPREIDFRSFYFILHYNVSVSKFIIDKLFDPDF